MAEDESEESDDASDESDDASDGDVIVETLWSLPGGEDDDRDEIPSEDEVLAGNVFRHVTTCLPDTTMSSLFHCICCNMSQHVTTCHHVTSYGASGDMSVKDIAS